jgi:hypothetical protein
VLGRLGGFSFLLLEEIRVAPAAVVVSQCAVRFLRDSICVLKELAPSVRRSRGGRGLYFVYVLSAAWLEALSAPWLLCWTRVAVAATGLLRIASVIVDWGRTSAMLDCMALGCGTIYATGQGSCDKANGSPWMPLHGITERGDSQCGLMEG